MATVRGRMAGVRSGALGLAMAAAVGQLAWLPQAAAAPADGVIARASASASASAPVLTAVNGSWTEADAVAAATRVEGPIRTAATWTAAGGPYLLDSVIEVRSDASLTVDAGTVIILIDGGQLLARGAVNFAGTREMPIVVRGVGAYPDTPGHSLLLVSPHSTSENQQEVTLSNLLVENTYSTVSLGSGHVRLNDTRFVGPSEMSYTYGEGAISPDGASPPVLDHVEFANQPTLSLNIDDAQVTNSRFSARNDDEGTLLSVWRGARVNNSSFQVTSGTAMCACFGFQSGEVSRIDAERNFWDATTEAAIEALVVDNWDFENISGRVDYDPWLQAAPAESLFSPAFVEPPFGEATGPGEVTVAWTPPATDGGSPLTGYRVRVWDGETLVSEQASPGDGLSTVVGGLTPGAGYRFQVSAENQIGSSTWSWASPTVTAIDRPASPTAVSVGTGNAQLSVSWQPPASDGGSTVTSYTVTVEPGADGQPATSVTVAGSGRSTRVTGLRNGIPHSVTVTATNSAGTSQPSTPVTAVPAGVPDQVGRPTATVDGQRVVLRWKAPDNNGSPLIRYEVTGAGKKVNTPPGVRKVVYRLLKAGTYKLRVVAVNGVGASLPSQPRKVVITRS